MVVTAVTTTMATGLTSTTTLKFASTAVLSNMAATAVTTTMATVLTFTENWVP